MFAAKHSLHSASMAFSTFYFEITITAWHMYTHGLKRMKVHYVLSELESN